MHHKWENLKFFDINHPNLQEILKFKFKNGLSTLLSSYDRWLPVKSTQKSVSFNIEIGAIQIKQLNLTMEELELSTFFGVSLHEMKLLSLLQV